MSASIDLHDIHDRRDVKRASLAGSAFDAVNLTGARFENANLSHVSVDQANPGKLTINGGSFVALFAATRAQTSHET